MSEDWDNKNCPKCGRPLRLVIFYGQWRWKCQHCDTNKKDSWYANNIDEVNND